MKLPVYLYGHPVLREISDDITPDYPELKKLVADMFETMYVSEGVGLAAPQIGRNDRIVVIDASPWADTFPECDGWKHALINPEIEVLDGETISRSEGCLSLPGISEDVKRVEHIRLRWLDEDFQSHEQEIVRAVTGGDLYNLSHIGQQGKIAVDGSQADIRKER